MTVVLLVWGWTDLGSWLARADLPRKADVIICLSSPDRIRKAAQLFQEGLAPRIILTVAKEKTPLSGLGVPERAIILAPGPKTTFQEALAVARILNRSDYKTALVVSDPYHLKRVRWTFRQVFGETGVKMSFVASDFPWEGEGWWKNKKEEKIVYLEVTKIGWYWLVHGLLGMKDDPPWSLALKQRYEKFLSQILSGSSPKKLARD